MSEDLTGAALVAAAEAVADQPEVAATPGRGVTVRPARDADGAAIIDLVQRVWSEYPGKTLNVRNDMPELIDPETSYAECDGRFWVVERDGEIIGSIAARPSADGGVLELQKLYVKKSERRHGFGSRLCRLVEDEARRRGMPAVELWSDIKLLDAHRLYEDRGYERGGLKTYSDTSGTVRCYYRKTLIAAERPLADADAVWRVREDTSTR
jgi:GNAT superfamily N-acetyltransferase